MRWATTRTKSPRVRPTKTAGNRRDLRPYSACPSGGRDGGHRVTPLDGCQSNRHSRSVGAGGKSRVPTVAADHDLPPEAPVTPVGIVLPTLDELWLYGITSKVTSACLVDCLGRWWEVGHDRLAPLTTLVLNLDNGPENQSRRTPCMRRMVDFASLTGLTVRLAYSPPYHSTYNRIERCWGSLEHHWNGALLDSMEAVIQLATTMPWKGQRPVVERSTTTYQTGVKLTKEA